MEGWNDGGDRNHPERIDGQGALRGGRPREGQHGVAADGRGKSEPSDGSSRCAFIATAVARQPNGRQRRVHRRQRRRSRSQTAKGEAEKSEASACESFPRALTLVPYARNTDMLYVVQPKLASWPNEPNADAPLFSRICAALSRKHVRC